VEEQQVKFLLGGICRERKGDMKKYITVLTVVLVTAALCVTSVRAAPENDTQAQLEALRARVAELEAQVSEQSYQQRNAELMKELVNDMDTKPFHQAADTALTAGYDKRFFIKTADDQFKLEFDTRLQVRYSWLQTANDDLSTEGLDATDWAGLGNNPANFEAVDSTAKGFELERARVYFRGHVLKDLKYNFAIAADDESSNGAYMYIYELSYSFMPEFGVRAGRFKGPFGKQETTSSGRQMLIDRSLANEVFNIDRCSGLELFGDINLGEIQPHYAVMVFNGLQNNNDTPLAANDNTPALAGRITIPMLGATLKDFENESDLKGHDNPVMQLGVSCAYSNDRKEDHFAGGDGDSYEFLGKSAADGNTDIFELGGEVTMFGADLAMKYQGLSAIVEGFYQQVNVDSGEVAFENDFGSGRNIFDPISGRAMIDGCEVDNMGWYAQAGYFVVPQKFELVGRIGGVHVDSSNDSYEYAGGCNYYISGQDLKVSLDVTYVDNLPVVSTSPNFVGVQNDGLIMVRSQLQFQF